MENNLEYFARRAAEEQDAASKASDSRAKDAHLEMAKRYGEACQAPSNVKAEDEPIGIADVPVRNITVLSARG